MLIVNKSFNDYYDSILSLGIDSSIVYNRKDVEIILPEKHFLKNVYEKLPRQSWVYNSDNHYEAFPLIIGFCGTVKLCYHLSADILISTYYSNNTNRTKYCYSVDDIISFFKENKMDKELEKFQISKKRKSIFFNMDFNQYTLTDLFENINNDSNFYNLFIQYKVPLYVVEFKEYKSCKLILNPKLKDYNFQTQVDPFTMFQNISMFLSGVLGNNESKMVAISDKEKLIKAGMGNDSFKQASPGKKFNRRNKS